MPIDPEISLQAGRPSGPFGPDWNAIYQSQNQAYRGQLQQQDITGQNALREVFRNQNALDPNSGLPRPAALAPVFQADPSLGLSTLQGIARLRDEQNREMYNNLQTAQKYGESFEKNVMTPTIEYARELEGKGIPQDRRQALVEGFKRKQAEQWQKSDAVPDAIVNRLDMPYYDIPGGGSSWPYRSDTTRKRADAIAKGWKGPYTDSSGRGYWLNPYLGPGAFNQDRTAPYTPTGETERKHPLTPMIDQTPSGPVPIEFNPEHGPGQSGYTKDGQPYTPVNPQKIPSGRQPGTGAQTTEMLRVKGPDGKESTIPAVRGPQEPGQPLNYFDKMGNKIDPATIVTTKVPPSEAGKPQYSDEALDVLTDQVLAGDPAALKSVWGGAELRVQLVNSFAHKAKELWGDQAGANLAVMNAMFSAGEGALRALDRQRVNVKAFEGTALREANLSLELAPKGLAGQTPVLNRWIQAGRRGVEGDADVTRLDTAVKSLANEYARIMSSPGATGGVTSDHAREEAASLLNSAQNMEQFRGNIDIMKTSMANRVKAIDTTLASTADELRSGAGARTPLATPEANPPSEPSPTGVPRGPATSAPGNYSMPELPPDGRRREKHDGTIWSKTPDGKLHQWQRGPNNTWTEISQ